MIEGQIRKITLLNYLSNRSRMGLLLDEVSFVHLNIVAFGNICKCWCRNNTKRSHTQLDSRKQVIAFQDRVITINIKEAQHPLK